MFFFGEWSSHKPRETRRPQPWGMEIPILDQKAIYINLRMAFVSSNLLDIQKILPEGSSTSMDISMAFSMAEIFRNSPSTPRFTRIQCPASRRVLPVFQGLPSSSLHGGRKKPNSLSPWTRCENQRHPSLVDSFHESRCMVFQHVSNCPIFHPLDNSWVQFSSTWSHGDSNGYYTKSGMHGSNMGFSENRVPQNSNINHDQSSFSWLNGHTFDLAHFSDTTGLFPFYWPLKSIDWRRWTWSSKTTSVSWQRRLILMGIRWFIWVPTQIESPGVYKSGVDIDHPPCGIELARNAIFV